MLSLFLNKITKLRRSFKFKNLKIGKNSIIDYNTKIDIHHNPLIIGDNVYIKSIAKGYHAGMPFPTTLLIDIANAQITIGNNCRLNGVYVHAQKGVTIGMNTVIAAGVNIIDSNGHIANSENRTVGRDTPKEIFIGNNVWVGLNAIILKGTTIGDNCIVSAGSVVKGVFEQNTIITGNPAKIVGKININNESSNP